MDQNSPNVSKKESFWNKLLNKISNIPQSVCAGFKKCGNKILKLLKCILSFFKNLGKIFKEGSLGTKLSYVIMGSGVFLSGQRTKGIIYFAIQILFTVYMATFGLGELAKFPTLGTILSKPIYDENTGLQIGTTVGDNSLTILLFSVMSLVFLFIVALLYVKSIKNSFENDKLVEEGKKPEGFRQDIRNMFDKDFHITLLFAPVAGVVLLTIIPLIFMILIAFTNYDSTTQPPGNLFTWVGFKNFFTLFSSGTGSNVDSNTFFSILSWTLVWAFFSTVTTYVGGICLALMINKKGIKFKKTYRNMFVLTIAVPQFVSLLVISKFLGTNGLINELLLNWGVITDRIPFLEQVGLARTVVIVVNMWVGLPYTMLSMTGILMNIPSDMYEAARIDGASNFKMFTKITLPYMLIITGPYLITQFIGNINNFNVIFLLTGGGPNIGMPAPAGKTDLLITWLYDLTIGGTNPDYKMGSVIGILVFIVCAVSSLFAYRYIGNQAKEETFQ